MLSIIRAAQICAAGVVAGAMMLSSAATAQTINIDFEGTQPLVNSRISGATKYFAGTTQQANTGSQSIKFVEGGPEVFENFTYDIPFALTSGTITLWFYDARGPITNPNPFTARWGGSIILEDKNNPADFGAVEIAELNYGGGRYYGTEGSVDRKVLTDKFDSANLPLRTVGFHKVEFQVGPTETTILVDGVPAGEVGAPGGDKTLRLRFMLGAATNGNVPPAFAPPGYQANWFTTAAPFVLVGGTLPWVYWDDLTITAQTPTANTHTMGFENPGTPEYDSAFLFMIQPLNDNPNMRGFVNQWDVVSSATVAHNGTQAAYFANKPERFKSVAVDLSGVPNNTTVTLYVYDAIGSGTLFDKFGGSVIVENGSQPADFIAMEVWNADYPVSSDPTPGGPNYYLTKGTPGSPGTANLYSRKFGNRSIGWHKVEIFFTNTTSRIYVNGRSNDDNGAVITGPGLATNPKLRLMADSPTSGGFGNYTDMDELQVIYFQTLNPYVYFDNITIPQPPASADNWSLYE